MNKQKETIVVSFSGGKTSAYMCFFLLKDYSHLYNFVFIFANTGQECEETLIFVDKVDKAFGLDLVWVEAVTSLVHGEGVTHKIVDFKTASRQGEPFEQYIAFEGVPNMVYRTCSERLKKLPINHYKKTHGLKGVKTAIGIRKDEDSRKVKDPAKDNIIYPLCDWFETDKQDVNTFWENQSFTLELEEHQGNCKTCWKKSDNKLFLLAHENPEKFDFFDEMEKKYGHIKPDETGRRVFFRNKRSAQNILEEAKLYSPDVLRRLIGLESDQLDMFGGCTESCEAYF